MPHGLANTKRIVFVPCQTYLPLPTTRPDSYPKFVIVTWWDGPGWILHWAVCQETLQVKSVMLYHTWNIPSNQTRHGISGTIQLISKIYKDFSEAVFYSFLNFHGSWRQTAYTLLRSFPWDSCHNPWIVSCTKYLCYYKVTSYRGIWSQICADLFRLFVCGLFC